MPAIDEKLVVLSIVAALGCGGDRPASMTPAEVQKTIVDENDRNDRRIKSLEKKYGKDHPIVNEERGNIGRVK